MRLNPLEEKTGKARSEEKAGKARMERILFLDILRGLAVLNMVTYHLLYDLVYIFGIPVSWFSIRKCFVWEQFICFTFILIAGISFHLSRRPWRNGLKLWGCALILTAVTLLVIPEEMIAFGILHFLGSAVLLTWVCGPFLEKIPAAAGFAVSLLLFVVIRHIPEGRLGIVSLWEWKLPVELYSKPFLFWAGFPAPQFFSADYFPVLPWILLFWVGYFGGSRWIRGSERLRKRTALPETPLYRILDRSLGWVGRKSIWIYMLHQPVIYGALLLLRKAGRI